MDHVTLGNPSRKDREKRQTAKSGDDSAISQRTAANRSAKDSCIPPLSSSEEINPPGRQEDRNISPTSLPQPDGDAPNLALGSNSSADELPETRSISADPGTNVSRALIADRGWPCPERSRSNEIRSRLRPDKTHHPSRHRPNVRPQSFREQGEPQGQIRQLQEISEGEQNRQLEARP